MNSYPKTQSSRFINRFGLTRLRPLAASCSALILLSAFTASAATFSVISNTDSGPGSLRAAIGAATNGDTVTFALQTPATIKLTSGELLMNRAVTIAGPGPGSLVIDGGGTNTVFDIRSNAIISGLTIMNGYSSGAGVLNGGAAITLSNVTVTANAGYGILCQGGTVPLSTVVLWNSTVSSNTHAGICANRSASFLVNNCAIVGNGGGFYLAPGMGSCFLFATNVTISGNSASKGGGIFASAGLGGVGTYFSNVNISSNSAGSGGGIYADRYTGLTLANLTMAGNSGGAIYMSHSGMTLSNAVLIGNSGGAVHIAGDIDGGASGTIMNCLISSNSASSGGAVYVSGVQYGAGVQVMNSTVSYNWATDSGGAIYSSAPGGGSSVGIAGSTFNGNSAANGGAICIVAGPDDGYAGSSFLGITNSTFSGNSAVFGGGIYNYCVSTDRFDPVASTATAVILSCTFSGNTATNGGGGIFNTNGGGNALMQIGGNILNAGAFGGSLFNVAGTVSSLGYNLSSDSAGGVLGALGDQTNTDPMLGPLRDNGNGVLTHALLPGSPAINQGKYFAGSAWDERGLGYTRRYQYPGILNAVGGDGTDIGAFELQPPLSAFAIWQFQNFGCTNCSQAEPDADPDGDGASNMSEYLAGTDPNNSGSVFRMLSVKPQGNDLLLTWQSVGGRTNVLQSSGSLANGSFLDVSPAIVIAGSGDATNTYLEVGGVLNGTNSFYRVRLGP